MTLEDAKVPADALDDVVAPLPGERRQITDKLVQYAAAALGPVVSAGTQFLLSLTMLRLLPPGAFGTFTFLLVVTQLSWGIWSALFCAPLPVLIAGDAADRAGWGRVVAGASTIGAVLSLAVFGAIAVALGIPLAAGVVFAAYGAVALVRWFARAHAYVHARQLRTMASDLAYSLSLLLTLAVLLAARVPAELSCYLALLVGAIVGLLPFGRALAAATLGDPRRYGEVWRQHARWALAGVVSTEATANAHVYVITLLHGPAAFAPIAAASLLVRPVNVAQNALSDFERPQMAKLVGQARWPDLARSLLVFRLVLATIWLGTAALGFVLFATWPRLIFPAAYDLRLLAVAALLWGCVAALRLAQTPESVMLQAGGAFRPLAIASGWSSLATVACVLILVFWVGTLASIGGLALGAAIYWYLTWRHARAWLAGQHGVESRRCG